MKTLGDILKKKGVRVEFGARRGIDEKTTSRVFWEMAKKEIPNLENSDVREMILKNRILYIKAAHPTVSSELFLKREKILQKTNEILGEKKIEKAMIG